MKKFMEPAIEMEVFAVEDVIATSVGGSVGCTDELPLDEEE